MFLDHLMAQKRRYGQLKEMAQCRVDWRRWSAELPKCKAPKEELTVKMILVPRVFYFVLS